MFCKHQTAHNPQGQKYRYCTLRTFCSALKAPTAHIQRVSEEHLQEGHLTTLEKSYPKTVQRVATTNQDYPSASRERTKKKK
jgi:hypothetical protein